MRSGPLNRRITIQRPTRSNSLTGAGSETWSDHQVCWAEVRQRGGREFLTDAGPYAEVRRVFFIRWFADLRTSDRVLYDGVFHNIAEVREIGRREGLELHTVASPFRATR